MRVVILDIDGAPEAQLLRLAIEALGAEVRLVGVGRPSDFFAGFDFYGMPADVAVISGHGDEAGFIFPALGEGVDPLVLPADRLGAELLTTHLTGVPPTVISTACETGRRPMVSAFLAAGARVVVAPEGYPDGAAVAPLLHLAFYRVLHGGADWPAAIRAANTFFIIENQFTAQWK